MDSVLVRVADIHVDIKNQTEPPTSSGILSHNLLAYNWYKLKEIDIVSLYSITTVDCKSFILKSIKLCVSFDNDSLKILMEILKNEMDYCRKFKILVDNICPKIVDFKYYKHERYYWVDILFKMKYMNYEILEDNLKAKKDPRPLKDLVGFLRKLEDSALMYGLIREGNNLVMGGSFYITILGIGRIEAAVIYGVETNDEINKQNNGKLINYVKEVTNIDVNDPRYYSINGINELLNPEFLGNGNDYVDKSLILSNRRFNTINKDCLKQVKMSAIDKPKTKSTDYLCVCSALLIFFISSAIVTLVLSIYYGYKYHHSTSVKFYGRLNDAFTDVEDYDKYLKTVVNQEENNGRQLTVEEHYLRRGEMILQSFVTTVDTLVAKYLEQARLINECRYNINSGLIQSFPFGSIVNFYIYDLSIANDFIKGKDGIYYIVGAQHYISGDSTRPRAVLLKTNYGKIIYSNIGRNSGYYNAYNAIISCDDNGIAVGGIEWNYYRSLFGRMFIDKYMQDSNQSYMSTLFTSDYSNNNATREMPNYGVLGLIEDFDGIIAVGTDDSHGQYGGFWFGRISKYGELLWYNVVPNENPNYFPMYKAESAQGRSIIKCTHTNLYIAAGYANNITTLMMFQSNGAIMAHVSFTNEYTYIRDIIEVDDGLILMLGDGPEFSYWSSIKIIKTDFYGNPQLSFPNIEYVKSAKESHIASTLAAIPDGFIVGGARCYEIEENSRYWRKNYIYYGSPHYCNDWLVAYDRNGYVKWQNTFSNGVIKKVKYIDDRLIILKEMGGTSGLITLKI